MNKAAFINMMHAAELIVDGTTTIPGFVEITMGGYDLEDEERNRIAIRVGDHILYEIIRTEKKEAQNGESL